MPRAAVGDTAAEFRARCRDKRSIAEPYVWHDSSGNSDWLMAEVHSGLAALLGPDAASAVLGAAAEAASGGNIGPRPGDMPFYTSLAATMPVSMKVHTAHSNVAALSPLLGSTLAGQLAPFGALPPRCSCRRPASRLRAAAGQRHQPAGSGGGSSSSSSRDKRRQLGRGQRECRCRLWLGCCKRPEQQFCVGSCWQLGAEVEGGVQDGCSSCWPAHGRASACHRCGGGHCSSKRSSSGTSTSSARDLSSSSGTSGRSVWRCSRCRAAVG
ncbi:hypothetical protein COO60DRAFT_513005 [Scenedesmus sp. NREL 46B-D3]|nr:hypothetical protein COO60DRAFT_513005 [Scenedesmus sp. NREL 46B-D3]